MQVITSLVCTIHLLSFRCRRYGDIGSLFDDDPPDTEYDLLPLCDDIVRVPYRQDCTCHNIKINGTGSLTGNGTCDSFHNGKPWCYVIGEHSTCSDKQLSSKNEEIQKIFGYDQYDNDYVKDVYFSHQACESQDQKSVHLETFMQGVEITIDKTQRHDNDTIGVSYPEGCQHECFARRCQAWTFLRIQDETRNCFLYFQKSDICENTDAAKHENPQAISGFSCPDLPFVDIKCWSTNGSMKYGFCPYIDIDYRADGSGSDKTIHTSATVGIGAVKNPRQYSRLNFKFVNGRWRAVRPKNQES